MANQKQHSIPFYVKTSNPDLQRERSKNRVIHYGVDMSDELQKPLYFFTAMVSMDVNSEATSIQET